MKRNFGIRRNVDLEMVPYVSKKERMNLNSTKYALHCRDGSSSNNNNKTKTADDFSSVLYSYEILNHPEQQ